MDYGFLDLIRVEVSIRQVIMDIRLFVIQSKYFLIVKGSFLKVL